jgi:hypothetical protein
MMGLIAAGLARARWSEICCVWQGDPCTITRNGPTMGACRETEHRSEQRISKPARRLGGATGRGFMPGRSGNPAGRAKGIEALAREHTPAAIAALVKALENPKERVPAAVALVNRGWGLPRQTIETDPATNPALPHLIAAQAASQQMLAALAERRTTTINGQHAEPSNGQSDGTIDILSLPPPLE